MTTLSATGKICIAATFTAEPVADALNYWIKQFDIPLHVEFAPYNQVFQQLLDPASLFAQNKDGINVILVRFEDWQRDLQTADIAEHASHSLTDLENALLNQHAKIPCIVLLCPASPARNIEIYIEMEQRLSNALVGSGDIHLVSSAELTRAYPVQEYYDPHTDQLGHIPYTPTMYAAIGSILARKIIAWRRAPYKVIVLDCDNTLWRGVCAEESANGIELSAPFQALQEFMLTQRNAGMLLCLCSKNEEADVWAVFDNRPDMRLKRDDLVAWRINWQAKSANIQSLAAELGLGLDSFIFIDDNPLECAEVQANCPNVLTLPLPAQTENIPGFLAHVWAFDKWRLTEEDKQRSDLYKQNTAREQLRTNALTFQEFLAGLALKVEINEMTAAQLPRVAQLTERTNQFNLTTRRRTESELQNLCLAGPKTCLVVQASDRFGDYGLVGVIIFEQTSTALIVDTFLMSCRVLGRGIEQRMLAYLGEIATQQGLAHVEAQYIPTAKNRPALTFLQMGQEFAQGNLFQFPAAWAAAATERFNSSVDAPQPVTDDKAPTTTPASLNRLDPEKLIQIAQYQSNAANILSAIQNQPRKKSGLQTTYLAPRNQTEQMLATMWAEVLGIEQVGIDDDFHDLGGDSLLALRLVAKTHQAGLPFTPKDFSRYSTIASLTAHAATSVTSSPQTDSASDGSLFPLTIAQRWFFNQGFHYPQRWNMAKLLETPANSNPLIFEQITQHLWNHHDALRTRFAQTKTGWQQNIAPANELAPPISYRDFSMLAAGQLTDAIECAADEIQASLDITNGPLMRIVFFDLGENRRGRLLIVLHHLIYDGASSIFFDDFDALFEQISQGQPAQLPVKTDSIWQWVRRLEAYTDSSTLRGEADYWLTLPWNEIRALPLDTPENHDQNTWASARIIQSRLDPKETETLLREIPRVYGVQGIDILITALGFALTKWSNNNWSLLDVVDFGRNALPNLDDLDLSRTVGWFSMDRHLLFRQDNLMQPADLLRATHAQLQAIPNRGLGYQFLRYGSNDAETVTALQQLPRAEIALNYEGYQHGKPAQATPFTPAYETPGLLWDSRDQRPYLLDCSAQIVEGRLVTRLRYSKNLHQQATIKRLSEDYTWWLQALLAQYQSGGKERE